MAIGVCVGALSGIGKREHPFVYSKKRSCTTIPIDNSLKILLKFKYYNQATGMTKISRGEGYFRKIFGQGGYQKYFLTPYSRCLITTIEGHFSLEILIKNTLESPFSSLDTLLEKYLRRLYFTPQIKTLEKSIPWNFSNLIVKNNHVVRSKSTSNQIACSSLTWWWYHNQINWTDKPNY